MNRDEPQMHTSGRQYDRPAQSSRRSAEPICGRAAAETEITLWRAGVLVGLLLLWEIAARLGWIDSFIMSSPSRILDTLFSLGRQSDPHAFFRYTL